MQLIATTLMKQIAQRLNHVLIVEPMQLVLGHPTNVIFFQVVQLMLRQQILNVKQ